MLLCTKQLALTGKQIHSASVAESHLTMSLDAFSREGRATGCCGKEALNAHRVAIRAGRKVAANSMDNAIPFSPERPTASTTTVSKSTFPTCVCLVSRPQRHGCRDPGCRQDGDGGHCCSQADQQGVQPQMSNPDSKRFQRAPQSPDLSLSFSLCLGDRRKPITRSWTVNECSSTSHSSAGQCTTAAAAAAEAAAAGSFLGVEGGERRQRGREAEVP